MSSGSFTGKMVVDQVGTVYFSACPTDRGRVPTGNVWTLEELMASGVDGRRWRRRFRQRIPFRMMSTADGATASAGEALAELYETLIGEFCTLTVIRAGVTKTWRRVKIRGCVTNLQPGSLTGFGADAASAFVLDAQWDLVLTEDAS